MEEYEFKEVTKEDARLRNLLISIAKGILKSGRDINSEYSIEEIEAIFYFRKKDIVYHLDKFFIEKSQNKYTLIREQKKIIKNILKEHDKNSKLVEDIKIVFIKSFGRYYKKSEKSLGYSHDYEEFNLLFSKIKTIIPILHWGILPIVPEHIMINSMSIPEYSITGFYDHYHMLEMMLREIYGEGEVMSTEGDKNLDKEMILPIYSRRWGHVDNYRIKRTIDGWEVSFFTSDKKSDKDGEGALFKALEHDSIFFPRDGVRYALKKLWYEAEESGLTIDELQSKLIEIADWISTVEKTVGEKQPEWVNYY
ncbi:MAG: hypothetical protein KIC98_04685 [Clostridioides difficile]|nr:hypothetical protein [Clostridioides difficile]